MQQTDTLAFSKRQRFGVVSTVAEDGRPESAVVGLAFTDAGDAIFDTLGSSRKARNLRRDARASLVVWKEERTSSPPRASSSSPPSAGAELQPTRGNAMRRTSTATKPMAERRQAAVRTWFQRVQSTR